MVNNVTLKGYLVGELAGQSEGSKFRGSLAGPLTRRQVSLASPPRPRLDLCPADLEFMASKMAISEHGKLYE